MRTLIAIVLVSAAMSAAGAGLPAPLQGTPLEGRVVADTRARQYVLPTRVVWQTPGESVTNAGALLERRSGQVTLDANNPCTLTARAEGASVLLDFGTELQGGVQIMVWHTDDKQPVHLRVRFGESVSEAMSEIGGATNATNDHAIRDQVCLVPWLGTHEIGNTGFRFVRIDFQEPEGWVQLKSVRAVFVYRDVEYKGSFRCSDDRLNRIWSTGAYTVHLNMQDYLWDGIKRDRLVWIGDMHPETMTILSVFGADGTVPASLDLIRDETPPGKWMNGISSYSMWWIRIHRDWFWHTGDLAYLREQQPYLAALLNQLMGCIGPDGRERLPEMRFLDWPSRADAAATHAGLHALLVATLDDGAELCDVLGDAPLATRCRRQAERLRAYVPDPGNSKQAAALIALAGLAPAEKMNSEVMAVDGSRRMSTFYGYYVLQARALAGDHQGALDCIRTYWGGMLDLGATTFWEDFDLDWTENAARIDELVPEGKIDVHGAYGNYCYLGFRHSLCHGWASGPTAWLTEHVLGIRVMEPGCKTVGVFPHLGDLDWAEGTFPTPWGTVKVRHERAEDGSVKTTVQAPPEVTVKQSAP